MAKYYVPKEVYDSMTGVASNKNEYEYQKSEYDKTGGQIGAGYQKFSEQAAPQYDVINAYSPELAANIKNMNAAQTRDLLKEYGVARDAKTIADEILANKHGYEKVKANGGDYKQYETAATSLYDELSAVDPAMATMLRNLSYQEALNWRNSKAPTNGSEMHIDTHKQLGGYKDTYVSNMETMYFDPDYGKHISDKFTAYGGAKGNQAAANAASDNGGNFDSFSEYNKNATNLAYQLAGEGAIQRMREGYSKGMTDFLGTWGNQMVPNAANFSGYDYKKDALAAEERMNDKTLESNLEGIKHTNLTNYDIAQLEADAQKYGYDVEKVIADINAEIAREGYISQEKIAEIQAKAKKVSGTSTGTGGYKPTLTASQANQALKDGIINESTVSDYNTHFGTDFTVDEAKRAFGYDNSESIAQQIADEVNETMLNSYSLEDVVTQNNDGTYTVAPESMEYVALRILKDTTLNEEEKLLMLEMFNIGEDTVSNIINDPHYN